MKKRMIANARHAPVKTAARAVAINVMVNVAKEKQPLLKKNPAALHMVQLPTLKVVQQLQQLHLPPLKVARQQQTVNAAANATKNVLTVKIAKTKAAQIVVLRQQVAPRMAAAINN